MYMLYIKYLFSIKNIIDRVDENNQTPKYSRISRYNNVEKSYIFNIRILLIRRSCISYSQANTKKTVLFWIENCSTMAYAIAIGYLVFAQQENYAQGYTAGKYIFDFAGQFEIGMFQVIKSTFKIIIIDVLELV